MDLTSVARVNAGISQLRELRGWRVVDFYVFRVRSRATAVRIGGNRAGRTALEWNRAGGTSIDDRWRSGASSGTRSFARAIALGHASAAQCKQPTGSNRHSKKTHASTHWPAQRDTQSCTESRL